ncbi:MAG: hypothetical protein ABFR95_09535 [Actinomycetota bacterium]
MKRVLSVMTGVLLLTALFASAAIAAPPASDSCATIKSGDIVDSAGNPISIGFDEFGYNYQAHMFNGTYDSSDRKMDGMYWGQEGDFVDDKLMMKWSDSWLANVDCDGDGKLDRGLVDGVVNGVSMGWLTNHVVGDYTDADGIVQHTSEFIKIGWVGPEAGDLWGQYTIIQEIYNDSGTGEHGLLSKIASPGFGQNDHWTAI